MRVISRKVLLLAGLSFVFITVTARALSQSSGTFGEGKERNILWMPEEIVYKNPSSISIRKSRDPSGDYCRVIITGHHFTSLTGSPELPVFSRLIEVPAGTSLKVTLSDVKTTRLTLSENKMKGLQIYPSQPERSKEGLPDETVRFKNKKLYRERDFIRHDTVIASVVGRFRGNDLINIAFYPAFYNPSKGVVDVITSMKADIEYSSVSKGAEKATDASTKGSNLSKYFIAGFTDRPVNMVICTDRKFEKALQPLIEWKTLKGIRITPVYREDGTADVVYQKLKDTLSYIYASTLAGENPLQYLLIVGDPTIIPTSRGTTNVSDLYYGEFDGNGDYIPEIFIGRLPVKDTIQLKAVVKKIIDYETFNFSPGNNFWSGALTTAGNDEGYADYMNGQVNYIYNNYLLPDVTIDGYKWNYPASPLKDDSIKILINNGLGLLNYTGHGESGGLADPSLKVPVIPNLTNTGKYPLLIANACRTAQINVTPCFGTEMLVAADKGVIGYIGCTNDSYWSDDFYWAIGPGTPGIDATYENTGLGAFDRLFHTHGEEPGDWVYTLGQLNFAGNMAVSESTSSWKKYYWETYILLGDPSVSPYIGKPDTFDISVPDSLPQDLQTLSFFAKPFAYAALTDFDTIWDAKFVNHSGNISLSIPQGTKDSCLLVLTGQNMVPLMKTVYFGNISGEFLTISDIQYDDSQGNNNNSPDYGERINLKVTVRNLGEGDATNLSAEIAVAAGMISLEQSTATIGTIAGGGSYVIDGSFVFNVSDEVSDKEEASLTIDLYDQVKSYQYGIDMTLLAPDIKIISSVPDDTSTGNSNYLPDPGETVTINISVINQGSSYTEGSVSFVENSPYLSVTSTGNPVTLAPGEEKTISFEAAITTSAVSGTVIPYSTDLVCGKYSASESYTLCTGKTRETWEHNRFDVFPWIRALEYPWILTSSSSYENVMSARSAILPDEEESILALVLNTPVRDTLSFFSRVSSEVRYDKFIFRIDSIENLKVTGEIPWGERKVVIRPGIHYLEWVYSKDVSLSGGNDAVWIDMITFPDVSFLSSDIEIDTVYAPSATAPLNNITISGRVVNLGRNTLTSFPLAYRINNQEPVNETFFLKIDPGDTLDVTFTQPCSLQPDVNYIIYILNKLPEDGYAGNDIAQNSFIRTGIHDPSDHDGVLRVSPNPFSGTVTIYFTSENEANASMEIIDINGRLVYMSQIMVLPGENHFIIDPVNISPGAYTLRINENGRIATTKIVKIN